MSEFTSNVPRPYFGPSGVVLPVEDAVLAGVQADVDAALGGGVNPQLTSPQGQIATTETAIIGDSNAMFAWFCNQIDPALNSGRMQDGIGRIYFMTRIAAQPTIQPCACAGLNTTPIPVGALAQDPNTGLLWVCQQAGQIDVSGTVTIEFACTTMGPVPAPADLTIYQQVYGWESVAPSGDAVLGNDVETASQYEARRRASVAANARQILDAINGSVLALPGVLDVYSRENETKEIVTIGGITMGPHSIYVAVLGGNQNDVAMAIYAKKGPGCGYNGNTWTTIADPNPTYNPAPRYSVGYTIPAIVPFVVLVTLGNNSAVPADALSLIQQSIVRAFAGLDNGSRARIGSLVLASRYYSGVMALGPWVQIIEIELGILGSGATLTGSVSGTTLTVSAVASGALAPGQIIQDAGRLSIGTLVMAQLTGSTGGIGTYRLNKSQTILSEPMTATVLLDSAQLDIDQAPAVSALNVNLLLQ